MTSPLSAVSRRGLLAGAVAIAAVTSACTSAPEAPQPTPDPDLELTAAALAGELGIVATIDAAITAHPRLAASVAEARTIHETHIALLEQANLSTLR